MVWKERTAVDNLSFPTLSAVEVVKDGGSMAKALHASTRKLVGCGHGAMIII